MDYKISEQESRLAAAVRNMIADADPAELQALDTGQGEKIIRKWLERLKTCGYLKNRISPIALLSAQKELAIYSQELFLSIEIGSRLLAGLIADHGTLKQKEKFMTGLLAGKWIGAIGLSEPNSGALPQSLVTKAVETDDGYLLDGHKNLVFNASYADLFGVFAQINGRTALVVVPAQAEGIKVGEQIDTLGYTSIGLASVELAQVEVDRDQIIYPDAEQPNLIYAFRRAEDRLLTALSLGIIWRCVEEAKKSSSIQRTNGKPPAGYQNVRFSLAEMLSLAQVAEILAFRSCCLTVEKDRQAETVALCAKVFATDAACKISEQALQLMAAGGYLSGNPVENAFRNARYGPLAGHPNQTAHMLIADKVLDFFS
jgi:alkylation response protein AidB-like acyl-CoA dehydrogenase